MDHINIHNKIMEQNDYGSDKSFYTYNEPDGTQVTLNNMINSVAVGI